MNHATAKNLLIVTALSASFAVFLSYTKVSNDQPLDDQVAATAFLEGLEDERPYIGKISLTKGENAFVLEKDNGQWQIASHYRYPADGAVVNSFLDNLENTQKLKQRSNKPSLYHRMNLADQATSVRLETAAGDEIFAFDLGKVGKPLDDRATRFARQTSETQAWLISEPDLPDTSLMSWVNDTILTLDDSRVWRVSVTPTDGQNMQIVRSDNEFSLQNLAEDEEISDSYKLDALANSMNAVRFDDVKPDAGDSEFDTTISVTTYDGLMIEGKIKFADDGAWLHLRAAEGTAAEVDQMPETISGVPENLTNEIALMNNRFEGWLFRLPSYAQADVQVDRADLVTLKLNEETNQAENPQ